MPNGIKYNLSPETLALKKGDFYIATGDVPKGPTSTSGYWYGITPPSGGYTIYLNKVSNGPSIYAPSNNSELIGLTNKIAGTSFTGATQCLNYYATQTDKMVFNRDYEGIVTSGLTLCLDAGFIPSYQGSGTTWYDLGYSGFNGTLTNGPTYSTDGGGSIVFDGVDDTVLLNSATTFGSPSNISINIWVRYTDFIASNLGRALFRASSLSENVGFSVYQATDVPYNRVKCFVNLSTGLNVLNSITQLNTNQWYFITVTYNSSLLSLYINGVLDATSAGIGGIVWPSPARTPQFGKMFGSYFNGSIAQTTLYNRALSATEILQNYNAQKSRYIPFDTDAQAFITAAGITDSTQQNAINQLVLDLKSYSLWTKMSAIYPFVGGTSTTHKFNLKDPRDLDVAYRLAFFGGWTHNANGITGNGTNTYADTFSFSYRTIGVYSRVNGKFLGQSAASEDNEGFMSNYVGFEMFGNSLLANNNSINISGSPFTKMYTVVDSNNSNANSLKVYRNGIDTLTPSSAGATPWSKSINYVLGATRYAEYGYDMYPVPITVFESGFGVANIALACFSDSMFTALEAANLNNLVVTFQTALSRNV